MTLAMLLETTPVEVKNVFIERINPEMDRLERVLSNYVDITHLERTEDSSDFVIGTLDRSGIWQVVDTVRFSKPGYRLDGDDIRFAPTLKSEDEQVLVQFLDNNFRKGDFGYKSSVTLYGALTKAISYCESLVVEQLSVKITELSERLNEAQDVIDRSEKVKMMDVVERLSRLETLSLENSNKLSVIDNSQRHIESDVSLLDLGTVCSGLQAITTVTDELVDVNQDGIKTLGENLGKVVNDISSKIGDALSEMKEVQGRVYEENTGFIKGVTPILDDVKGLDETVKSHLNKYDQSFNEQKEYFKELMDDSVTGWNKVNAERFQILRTEIELLTNKAKTQYLDAVAESKAAVLANANVTSLTATMDQCLSKMVDLSVLYDEFNELFDNLKLNTDTVNEATGLLGKSLVEFNNSVSSLQGNLEKYNNSKNLANAAITASGITNAVESIFSMISAKQKDSGKEGDVIYRG